MAWGQKHLRILSDNEKQRLAGSVFEGLELDGVDLSGADLRGSRFACVSLRQCDLSGADLSAAQFIECDLRGATFLGVVLSETSFRGSLLLGAIGLSGDQRAYVRAQGGALQPWQVNGGRVAGVDALAG